MLIVFIVWEFFVFEYLMCYWGQVLLKCVFIEGVWDDDFDGDFNIVEVYVGYFCCKFDKFFGCEVIEIVCGVGYWLVVDGGQVDLVFGVWVDYVWCDGGCCCCFVCGCVVFLWDFQCEYLWCYGMCG